MARFIATKTIELISLDPTVKDELTDKIRQSTNKEVEVLGYTLHQGFNPTETIQEIQSVMKPRLGDNILLYETNTHDTLAPNLRRTMVPFRKHASNCYVIYRLVE
jgi:hypothetical protein